MNIAIQTGQRLFSRLTLVLILLLTVWGGMLSPALALGGTQPPASGTSSIILAP